MADNSHNSLLIYIGDEHFEGMFTDEYLNKYYTISEM